MNEEAPRPKTSPYGATSASSTPASTTTTTSTSPTTTSTSTPATSPASLAPPPATTRSRAHSAVTPATTRATKPPTTTTSSSPTDLDIATALQRVQDLEAALAASRTQQHRLAMDMEKLRMAQPPASPSRAPSNITIRPCSPPPHRPSSPTPRPTIPSIFSGSPPSKPCFGTRDSDNSNLLSLSSSADQDAGQDLMADAARSCQRMEDRLVFQRQLGRLRDTIYAQAEELNARKKERRSWGEERAGLMRELQERDERIRGLERSCVGGGEGGKETVV